MKIGDVTLEEIMRLGWGWTIQGRGGGGDYLFGRRSRWLSVFFFR